MLVVEADVTNAACDQEEKTMTRMNELRSGTSTLVAVRDMRMT